MALLGRNDIKVFITFLIIYSLFAHWVGWNEESRIALAKAIVKENRFEIDTFANFTGDRALYKTHYYSDKAPGISFFSTLVYLISHHIFPNNLDPYKNSVLVPEPQFNTTVYYPYTIPVEDRIGRILSVILFSALQGALLVLLIYKISGYFIEKDRLRILISISFGLGTLIFPYSTVLMGNVLSTFFAFLSFIIIFKGLKRHVDKEHFFLSGILLGLSILIDYLLIIVFISFLFLLFLSRVSKKSITLFFGGLFLGSLPLFFYNFSIFSNPFRQTLFYIDPNISPCAWGYNLLPTCPKYNIKDLIVNTVYFPLSVIYDLFLPYRGIFFYTPFLLFSIPGYYYLYKKDKNLSLTLLLIFLLLLLFLNKYLYWFGGSSFGQRYSVFMIPFLSIPVSVFLKEKSKGWIIIILFVLVLLSIFYNFLGLSTSWEGFILKGMVAKVDWFTKKIEVPYNLSSFLNPLYEHYFPAFLQNGPRSRILEQAIIGEIPDIRDFRPMPVREIKLFTLVPFGILVLKIPFLSLFIVLTIVTLIWQKELKKYKKLYFLMLVSLFVLFLSRLSFSRIVYGKEFYPLVGNETVRWFGNQSIIYIFSKTSGKQFLNISLNANRLGMLRSLTIYLNGKSIGKFYGDSIFQEVYLKKGENVLVLKSNERCEIPLEINKTYKDPRCLSFGIKNLGVIRINELPKNKIIFGSNFYEPEVSIKTNSTQRWSSANSTIFIFSDSYKNMFLNISLLPYKIRKIKLTINNESVGEYYQLYNIFEKITLKKGLNEIKFVSTCDIPALVENTTDYRCLSFLIKHINLVNISFAEAHAKIFGSNWYDWEQINGKKFRWASSNASIYLFSEKEEPIKVNITLAPYKEGKLIVIANGEPIINIYLKDKQTILSKTFEVKEGINKIVLSGECKIPFVVEKTTDKRCLAFFLYNFSVIKLNELPDGTIFYNNKFYEKETFDSTKFRWLSNNGEIDVISSLPGKLSFLTWTPPNFNTTLKLKVDKIFSKSYRVNPTIQKIEAPFFIPKNEIVFKASSENGCIYPKNDSRCLSIAFGNVTFIPLNIKNIKGKGFYGLEKDGFGRNFRWVSSSASLEFFSLGNFNKSLKIEIGSSYFKPRTLQIYWNNKLIKEKLIDKETSISLSLSINKGKNILLLKSREGCDIPASREKSNDKRCLSFMITNVKF